MTTYFHQQTHGFIALNPKYHFPASFIHQAQAAQTAWCKGHPVMCKAMWDMFHQQGKATPNTTCRPHAWWCYERGYISCAGGAMMPYWDCAGAYAQQVQNQVDEKLSTTDKILIVGGGTVIIAIIAGEAAPVIVMRAGFEVFKIWLGI